MNSLFNKNILTYFKNTLVVSILNSLGAFKGLFWWLQRFFWCF